MWEALVRERGGAAVDGADTPGTGDDDHAFACVLVADQDALPLIARLDADRPAFQLKSGRVGGGEDAAGSLAITEADSAAALDAALADDAEWERDPDLGLELLVSPVAGVDQNLLIPRFLYRRADRVYEYAALIPALTR